MLRTLAFAAIALALSSGSSYAGGRWTFVLLNWEARDVSIGPNDHLSQSTGFLIDNSGGKVSFCSGLLYRQRANPHHYTVEAACTVEPMSSAIPLGPNVESYAAAHQIVRNSTFENDPSFWQVDSASGAIQFCGRDDVLKIICTKPRQ